MSQCLRYQVIINLMSYLNGNNTDFNRTILNSVSCYENYKFGKQDNISFYSYIVMPLDANVNIIPS